MSISRLAELVGRSPSAIRAWEKDRSVPTDPKVVSSVAAVLGIPEDRALEAAGLATGETGSETVEAPVADPDPPAAERGVRVSHRRASWVEAATRAVATLMRRVTSRETPGRSAVGPSYMEDPEQRTAYRLRGVYTAVGLVALAVVGIWAAGNLLTALGDVWDAFFGG
jgi:transcriptional regulator with XRE-family HTH domain